MKIYNTMTRKKEEFVPNDPKEVKIYACGPTVYNYIHIGNARPLCVFDVLRRYLEYRGYNVNLFKTLPMLTTRLLNVQMKRAVPLRKFLKSTLKNFGLTLTD